MRNAVHAKSADALPSRATKSKGHREADLETTRLLLSRLHVELAALAVGVLTTQHALSPILSQLPSMPAEAIEEAQRLDLIEQSLRDLATVAAFASAATPDTLDLRAISDVCLLADLGARLRGDTPDAKPSTDLELF